MRFYEQFYGFHALRTVGKCTSGHLFSYVQWIALATNPTQRESDISCYADFDANNNNRAYCFTKRKKYLTVLSIEDDNRK